MELRDINEVRVKGRKLHKKAISLAISLSLSLLSWESNRDNSVGSGGIGEWEVPSKEKGPGVGHRR